MRVMLKFTIDLDVDAAWRALHSPAVMAELYGPFLTMAPLDPLPTAWEAGAEAAVQLGTGPLRVGTQLIHISDAERTQAGERVRIMRDSGIPLSGLLGDLDVWDHRIAVSDAGDARTLWRERLVFRGRTSALLWPGIWAMWQLREARVRALAPGWAHDPE